MKILKNIKDCYIHIPYTYKHIKAFDKLQKQTFDKRKYLFHDWDKIFMYIFLPFLGTEKIKEIHRFISRHHIKMGQYSIRACEEALIDWESGYLTKPDKPYNAAWIIKNKGKRDCFQNKYLELTLNRLHELNPNIKMECIKYSLMEPILQPEIKEG